MSHLHIARAALGAIAVAALVAPLAAQAGRDQAPPLILGSLYQEAEQSSPRVQAARAIARAADARVSPARRPPDPRVQLGFMNYSLSNLEPMEPLGMTQLQLMQMIPTAGKLRLAGRAGSARALAAAARASETTWEVRSRIAMVFYELYATDRSLDVARQTVRLLHDLLAIAESMYRVGEGRQADVLRAQVEIARMTEDTLRMRAMRTSLAARLHALLDRTADDAVGSPVLPILPEGVPERDSLLAWSQADRAMVRAGEQEVRAADADRRLARREIWPDLEVGIVYGRQRGEMGTEHMGSLMLGASLPIFARSRQLAMREEATAMSRMATAELAEMRAETRGRVGEVYADLTRARTLAALYRGTVLPQADATVASALSAYRVGSVDFMTVLDGRMTVNRYRQELFSLEAEEGIAWAELEMLTGRPLLDPFSTRELTND
jgi:cobalt-zinc-cadmium efflux system outer membrane protein